MADLNCERETLDSIQRSFVSQDIGQNSPIDRPESLTECRKTHTPREMRAVHARALEAATQLKKSEAEMIRALQDVDRIFAYRHLGYGSLRQYVIAGLKLSEAQADMYICVARKSIKFPKLQEAIEAQEISIWKALRISSVIDESTQASWLEMAKTLPKAKLEREIAKANPQAAVREHARYISDAALVLTLTIDEETHALLERVRELQMQKTSAPAKLADALKAAAKEFVLRHDPVCRAERAEARKMKNGTQADSVATNGSRHKGKKTAPANESHLARARHAQTKIVCDGAMAAQGEEAPFAAKNRRPLPAESLNQVHLRDRGRCQARLPDGSLCGESALIDVHHLIHVASGGSDEADNLVTLCRGHHRGQH